jgi:hypothetical protein
MQPMMLRISEDKAEVLQSDGWHETDWVAMPGGNFIHFNSAGYWEGVFQGGAAILLLALIVLGVYAGAVS